MDFEMSTGGMVESGVTLTTPRAPLQNPGT